MTLSDSSSIRRLIVRQLSRTAAAWEYYFRRDLRDPLGGPFNGQRGRQAILCELAERLALQGAVETGTYRGSTAEFIVARMGLPLWTVEARSRFYHFSRTRLRRFPGVKIWFGDSRAFLQRLAADPGVPKRALFFYLDAHWYEDLPLLDEVAIVTTHWSDIVIMVDDFQVPDDAGYGYDDYGAGKRLCLESLGPLDRFGLQAFFPALPSALETGRRRGCVVLADDGPAEQLKTAQTLRPASS